MNRISFCLGLFLAAKVIAAPVIDPLPNVSIPAGKSLIVPITASSPNGRPLTFTVTSSTNRIVPQLRTNSIFWKMSVVQVAPTNTPGAYLTPFRGGVAMVTNVGDMTFILFKDVAPRTVDAIAGLTMSGFYNSNTIFHRVVPGFVIQGGDPNTNGSGGPVFRYNDEFHPRALFSGHGQLALANSGKDTDGSQFFITTGPQRFLDLGYTLFGQLIRGFDVMTNIFKTSIDTNNRPFADVIITKASIVPNITDTALTLTRTNLTILSGTIKVIADDGAGGKTTNSFTASTASDSANNAPPIIYPNTVTNLVAAMNARLTNFVSVLDLEGNTNYWFPFFPDYNSYLAASNSTTTLVNGNMRFTLIPATGYVGPIRVSFYNSTDPNWGFYFQNLPQSSWPAYDGQTYSFAFGETAIKAWPSNIVVTGGIPFTNQLLAAFTNGIANSSATNFSASINWGDNSISSGSIVTNAAGRKEVRGAHTYTNSGSYPVYVTISGYRGASSTVIATSTVPPSVTLTRVGMNNTLRWPAWAFNYTVQTQTNFTGTNWSTLTNRSILQGYENVVTNTSASSNLYFRIKQSTPLL